MTERLRFRFGVDRLHLIELHARDWPGDDDLGNGPCPDILRQRLTNDEHLVLWPRCHGAAEPDP